MSQQKPDPADITAATSSDAPVETGSVPAGAPTEVPEVSEPEELADVTAEGELVLDEDVDDLLVARHRASGGEGDREAHRGEDEAHDDEGHREEAAGHHVQPVGPASMVVQQRAGSFGLQSSAQSVHVHGAVADLEHDQDRDRQLARVHARAEPGLEQARGLLAREGADRADAGSRLGDRLGRLRVAHRDAAPQRAACMRERLCADRADDGESRRQ